MKYKDPGKKAILRQKILAERDALSERERRTISRMICTKLFRIEQVRNASTIFVYLHFRSEVETTAFIATCLGQGKRVAVPCTLPKERQLLAIEITNPALDVEPGFCGIPEPVPRLRQKSTQDHNEIDVALIPGSVFDRAGGRLGYGGGYYDRFLSMYAPLAFRIGMAYEMQLVERVPVEQHDQFMDMVVTEVNIYDCRRNRHAQDSRLS